MKTIILPNRKCNITFSFAERLLRPSSKHYILRLSNAISIAPIISRNGWEVIKILVPIFTCLHIFRKKITNTERGNHREYIYTHHNKCKSHWIGGNELEDCTALKGKIKLK